MDASSDRRQGSPVAAPRFFKVIMDPKTERIKIPPEFMKRFGHDLPNRVLLKVPTGSTMEAQLIQCDDGKTWLQRGWPEFKQRYSIEFGCFLVFEYDGKSGFDVLIFDTSAVEINYSLFEDNGVGLDDDSPMFTRQIKEKCSQAAPGQMQKAVEKETSTAYRQALSFTSVLNNPFLIRLLGHSNVCYGFSLGVPLPFARQTRLYMGANSIVLVSDGKKWSVRCLVRDARAYLTSGWTGFVKDNGLKVGHVCVFVVAERTNLVWNVVIFRGR